VNLGYSIDIHIRIHYHFSTFFLNVGSAPDLTVARGPFQLRFAPWLKLLVTLLLIRCAALHSFNKEVQWLL